MDITVNPMCAHLDGLQQHRANLMGSGLDFDLFPTAWLLFIDSDGDLPPSFLLSLTDVDDLVNTVQSVQFQECPVDKGWAAFFKRPPRCFWAFSYWSPHILKECIRGFLRGTGATFMLQKVLECGSVGGQ